MDKITCAKWGFEWKGVLVEHNAVIVSGTIILHPFISAGFIHVFDDQGNEERISFTGDTFTAENIAQLLHEAFLRLVTVQTIDLLDRQRAYHYIGKHFTSRSFQ